MRGVYFKLLILLAAGLVAGPIGWMLPAWAGDQTVKITTYYPAPEGDYRELRTADDTELAMGGGGVTIGKVEGGVEPNSLKVGGSMSVEGEMVVEQGMILGTGGSSEVKKGLTVEGVTRADGGIILGKPSTLEDGMLYMED